MIITDIPSDGTYIISREGFANLTTQVRHTEREEYTVYAIGSGTITLGWCSDKDDPAGSFTAYPNGSLPSNESVVARTGRGVYLAAQVTAAASLSIGVAT